MVLAFHGYESPFRPDLYERPAFIRLFCWIGSIVLDEDGNGRDASVLMLDHVDGRALWRSWRLNRIAHWHPFKVRLQSTRRAGLHFVIDWRSAQQELRYGANYPIRDEGIYVINPSSAVVPFEKLEDALADPLEALLVRENLSGRFGCMDVSDARSILSLPVIDQRRDEILAKNEARG